MTTTKATTKTTKATKATKATAATTATTAATPERVGGVVVKNIETLKGVAANWRSGGTFPSVANDGDTFEVKAAVAAEYKTKDGGVHLYAALLCEFDNGAQYAISIKALIRQRVCDVGILTPQGDLAEAIRAEAATDTAEAAANIAESLRGRVLTLRRVLYVSSGKVASLCEAYFGGVEAATEDARLTRI